MRTLYESILSDIDTNLKRGDEDLKKTSPVYMLVEFVNMVLDNTKMFNKVPALKFKTHNFYGDTVLIERPVKYFHSFTDSDAKKAIKALCKELDDTKLHNCEELRLFIHHYNKNITYNVPGMYWGDDKYEISEIEGPVWNIKIILSEKSCYNPYEYEFNVSISEAKTLKAVLKKYLHPIFKDTTTCIDEFNNMKFEKSNYV